jgi:hypothetical protein
MPKIQGNNKPEIQKQGNVIQRTTVNPDGSRTIKLESYQKLSGGQSPANISVNGNTNPNNTINIWTNHSDTISANNSINTNYMGHGSPQIKYNNSSGKLYPRYETDTLNVELSGNETNAIIERGKGFTRGVVSEGATAVVRSSEEEPAKFALKLFGSSSSVSLHKFNNEKDDELYRIYGNLKDTIVVTPENLATPENKIEPSNLKNIGKHK